MYEDDLWYRKLVRSIEEHRPDFEPKQWRRFQMELMLRIMARVRTFSDTCGTCRGFQHTLTRLEEEFLELPGSSAQRRYQARQLRLMGEHFAAAHRLFPPHYHARLYAHYGLIGGIFLGIVVGLLVLSSGLYFAVCAAGGWLLGYLYGNSTDAHMRHDKRAI